MNACECWIESSYIEKRIEKSAGVNEASCVKHFECSGRVEKLCVKTSPFSIVLYIK